MASSSKNPLKRMGFKRTNTSEAGVVETTREVTELDELGEEPAVVSKIADEFGGNVHKGSHATAVKDISEAEANRRLSAFRAEHSLDPNLPATALEAIEDATRAHDQKGEAVLVDELVEDSPYPEVSWQPWSRACSS